MDSSANDSDTEEKQKEKLTLDFVKEDYVGESERSSKIREEMRSLLGSILVVVGFLLAAGTTSVVNIQSPTSLGYFVGVSLLIISIGILTIVMRIAEYVIPNRRELFNQLDNDEIKYRTILRRNIAMYSQLFELTRLSTRRRQHLLSLAWLFMIIGLLVIMVFIISSILLNTTTDTDAKLKKTLKELLRVVYIFNARNSYLL